MKKLKLRSPPRSSRALRKVTQLQERQEDVVFLPTQDPDLGELIYPTAGRISRDPDAPHCIWSPSTGPIAPVPMIVAHDNGTVAAGIGLTMGRNDAANYRIDVFRSGLLGLTLGYNDLNNGILEKLLREFGGRSDDTVLPGRSLRLLRGRDMAQDQEGWPMPGTRFSLKDGIKQLDRFDLTVGDLAVMAELLPSPLPQVKSARVAHAPPFRGPFARGGQIQLHPDEGIVEEHQFPEPKDLRARAGQRLSPGDVRAWGTVMQPISNPTGVETKESGMAGANH